MESAVEFPIHRNNDFPSFSIILEIENLAITGTQPLSDTLDGLANQSYSAKNANVFMLIDNGSADEEKLKALCATYPWVTVFPVPHDLGYYESKMEGVKHTTGDIVIFTDSDCLNQKEWLENFLVTFTENKDVDVLSGETSIIPGGPYHFASILAWSCPPFTGKNRPYQTPNYLANNVAFGRKVLLDCPLRQRLPVYRGNCAIHRKELRSKGYKIFKQPKSLTYHPLPAEGFVQFTWCWLLHGRHMSIWYRLIDKEKITGQTSLCDFHRDAETFLRIISECTYKPIKRLPRAIYNRPIYLIHMPIGLIIISYFLLCSTTGFFIALFNDKGLYRLGERRLKELAPDE